MLTIVQGHKQHFLVLDGMRGIAALIVAGLHARELMIGGRLLDHSYLAVDFFFCLSGFVIAYAYEGRLASGMRFATFAKLRLIRLYPMIFIGALLGGLVLIAGRKDGIMVPTIITIGTMLLIPAGFFFGKQAYPSDNPIWSLFFEVVANIVYALSPRLSGRFFGTLLLLSALGYVAICYAFDGMQLVGFDTWWSFAAGFVRVTFPFAAGVAIFRLGLHRRSGVPTWLPLIALPALLLVPIASQAIADAVIALVCLPALVVLGARTAPAAALAPWLRAFGELSYPLYLLHQPILRVVKNAPHIDVVRSIHPLLPPVLGIILAVVASAVAIRVYDRPVRKLLTTHLGRVAA
ncbi:acyltransferase [Sphingomonas sp. CD22]|uniref:acyltransferase family protein n=1 Tax=Sphingomonas sp. CD22 TaxID=3100214 RepID=UPI002ADFDC65|nr:acyltransferase [Sphingomonas sp. CD22]MEA1085951.1 acyltransferase [Sphingomonas sp. CD22]